MIAHIKGIVEEKFGSNGLIVDVGGVGYELLVPEMDYENCSLGDEKKFYTYHQVRENAEELYGFSSLLAKKLFELLISVQGVGPKAGVAIMSLAEAEEVRNAIANDDMLFVSKAAGVGKKTAERVVVELRDKVGAPSRFGPTEIRTGNNAVKGGPDEALDALIVLGFSLKEAMTALEGVDRDLPVEERVMLALKGNNSKLSGA